MYSLHVLVAINGHQNQSQNSLKIGMRISDMIDSQKNTYSALVRDAQLGNQDSMGQLANHIQNRIYTYFYHITLDNNLAEDLLQETLLAMVKYIADLQEVECFWPWIYRIARSKAQQHFRIEQRRRTVRLDYSAHVVRVVNSPASRSGVLEDLFEREALGYLKEAVNQLSPLQKRAVHLRAFGQMPYPEIASRVGCSEQQARLRYCRGKQHLREKLNVFNAAARQCEGAAH